VDINFSPTSPRARIVFRKLGDDKVDLVKTLLQQMIANGTTSVDLTELGDIAGLKLEEVKELSEPAPAPTDPAAKDQKDDDSSGGEGEPGDEGESQNARRVVQAMHGRVAAQIAKAERDGTLADLASGDLGHRKQFVAAIVGKGRTRADADAAYRRAEGYVADVISAGTGGFGSVASMCDAIERGLNLAIGED
jgi:hypothetical protein